MGCKVREGGGEITLFLELFEKLLLKYYILLERRGKKKSRKFMQLKRASLRGRQSHK